MNTGMTRMGFPCVGSWVTYGLGTESQNLPAFVRHVRHARPRHAEGPRAELGCGVPARASTRGRRSSRRASRSTTSTRPADISADAAARRSSTCSPGSTRRSMIEHPDEAELTARIESFELAYRMQMAAPGGARPRLARRRRPRTSTASTTRKRTHFAKQCLIARRLVERGVRFVQIYSRRHGERAELGRPQQHRQEPRRLRRRDRPADRRRCSTDLDAARPARTTRW